MLFSRVRAAVWLAAFSLGALMIPSAPALAGTTGSISGTVTAKSGGPVAGAHVIARSPSQVADTTTDAAGRFTFISLQPDTYTLSAEKTGYQPLSVAGVSVFADQNQTVALTMQTSLQEIARVRARSSGDLVRAGTTTDVYSVNPSTAAAAATLGGGGGLNNAYSAIAAMPGAYVPIGQMGVNQTVYIRGGYYDQIGYEYDGVPVNRSFDNYPGHSASTLGQQELQIYAGGGPATANATGLAGFINQVAKTGTYPGYAYATASVAGPAFYHEATVQAGGSTPDRRFSYYAGISGYDQDFRYFDQSNGVDQIDTYGYPTGPSNLTTLLPFYPAIYPTCANDATYTNPAYAAGALTSDPGCFSLFPPNYGNISTIFGREAITNFHIGVPHKHDSGHDDIQLLWQSSAQFRQYYAGVNDAGASFVNALYNQGWIGAPPHWPDYLTYPTGTPFLAPATVQPIAYPFPGSPTDRCYNTDVTVEGTCATGYALLPNDYRDGRWDTASIVKLQYQKNVGSNAYVRLFGYTFYSNTNRSGAARRGIGSGFTGTNYDYEVDSHTRGAQMDFADQLSSTNQISGMVDYITATTLRYNNTNYLNRSSQQVSNLTNGSQCFAWQTGTADNGIDQYTAGDPAPCNDSNTQGTFGSPTNGQGQNPCAPGGPLLGTPACTSGATWALTYLGNQGGLNSVTPRFLNYSLTDEWRPNDRWVIDGSIRFSNDTFSLANTNDPAKNFWFSAAQHEYCYNPVTFNPILVPQPPQNASTLTPYVTFNCPIDNSSGTPVQTVHPDGAGGHLLLSNNYPSTYTQSYTQPRLSMTYTANPDTVLRFSAGRYAQEPQNYEIQYNSVEPNLAAQLIGFLPFGFTTPLHEAQAQFSNNYDLSYERHFKGTDMSLKLTPFYRYATNQLYETVNVPTITLSPAFNSGTEKSSGLEIAVTKGDFARDGFSALFSYTLTSSKEKWNNYPNVPINPVDPYNQDIQDYNALTRGGGGAPCYSLAAVDPVANPYGALSGCSGAAVAAVPAASVVRNPYYASPAQPLLDKFGWYDTGLDYPYVSPNTFALILSYRHARFTVTPTMQLAQGASYGTPADVQGIDPRSCAANQSSLGVTSGDPLAPDYTSCSYAETPDGTSPGSLYIPNPQTGRFATFGEYRQPWQFNAGLQFSYDVSPQLTARVSIANLVNQCFGGSKTPWTSFYPPNSRSCGYIRNTFYVGGGFYNGAGPNDTAANGVPVNPYFTQSFVPAYGDTNSFNYPLPLNVYFQLQVKI